MLSLSRTDAIFAVGSEMNVQKKYQQYHTHKRTLTLTLTRRRTDLTNKYIHAATLIIAIFSCYAHFTLHADDSMYFERTTLLTAWYNILHACIHEYLIAVCVR